MKSRYQQVQYVLEIIIWLNISYFPIPGKADPSSHFVYISGYDIAWYKLQKQNGKRPQIFFIHIFPCFPILGGAEVSQQLISLQF